MRCFLYSIAFDEGRRGGPYIIEVINYLDQHQLQTVVIFYNAILTLDHNWRQRGPIESL